MHEWVLRKRTRISISSSCTLLTLSHIQLVCYGFHAMQKKKKRKKILIRCKLDVFEQDKVLYNEKVAQIALEEAGAASTNVKTFDELMKELAELESRIQQSADQSASVRVANLT
jgi:hypothetical protein